MIKTKRLLYVVAFAGFTLFSGLFYYHQLMEKALKKLAANEAPLMTYREETASTAITQSYTEMLNHSSSYLVIPQKRLRLIRKARQLLIEYRIISRKITDLQVEVSQQYGAHHTRYGTFTVLNNHSFFQDHHQMMALYDEVKTYRSHLTTICDDSLHFEMPEPNKFRKRFEQVPLALTYYELEALDHHLLNEASKALEYTQQYLYCGPLLLSDHCLAIEAREKVLRQLISNETNRVE